MFILRRSSLVNFAFAVKRLSFIKQYEKEIKKQNLELEETIKAIVDEMNDQLSDVVSNDLQFLCKKYHIYNIIINYGISNNDITVDDLIIMLKSLSIDEFKDFYRKNMFSMETEYSLEEIKDKISQHEANNTVSFLPTFKDFVTLEKEIELLLPRIIQCLDAIAKLYQQQVSRIVEVEAKFEKIFSEYLEEEEVFAEHLFVVGSETYDYRTMTVSVYISIFIENCLSFIGYKDKSKLQMIVGSGLKHRLMEASEHELELFKCLADPTKLSILEMIAKEKVCANDIAQRLKLTKATISYHMSKLILVGILKINLQEGKKAYYQVQEDVIKRGFDGYLERLKTK